MEDSMQDVYRVAINPDREQPYAVRTNALRRALDMRYVRTGDYVERTLGAERTMQQADTYRGYDLGHAALRQVRFAPNRRNVR